METKGPTVLRGARKEELRECKAKEQRHFFYLFHGQSSERMQLKVSTWQRTV
jgi:hypothetical protein